ncbi:MAG: hypothetical protein GXO26_02770 [Crenarchaeota archaeon]|nr:hypothetical protein [Thermoproteota archaeon]
MSARRELSSHYVSSLLEELGRSIPIIELDLAGARLPTINRSISNIKKRVEFLLEHSPIEKREKIIQNIVNISLTNTPLLYYMTELFFPERVIEIGGLPYVEYSNNDMSILVYHLVPELAHRLGNLTVRLSSVLFPSKLDIPISVVQNLNVLKNVGLDVPERIESLQDLDKILQVLGLPYSHDLLSDFLPFLAGAIKELKLDDEQARRFIALSSAAVAVPLSSMLYVLGRDRYMSIGVEHGLQPLFFPITVRSFSKLPKIEHIITLLEEPLIAPGKYFAGFYILILPEENVKHSLFYPQLLSERHLEPVMETILEICNSYRLISARRWKRYLEEQVNRGLRYLENKIPIILVLYWNEGTLPKVIPAVPSGEEDMSFLFPGGSVEELKVRKYSTGREAWWLQTPLEIALI